MSHTIRVTRRITTTTTVTRGSVMGINGAYLKTIPGILGLVETIVGAVVIGLCAGNDSQYNILCLANRELYLMVLAVACLITTFLIFVSCLCHQPTADTLGNTVFVLVFHCIAFLLYLSGAITVMVSIHVERYGGSRYTELLVASIFAIVNTVLYLISAILSYKAFKNKGGGLE